MALSSPTVAAGPDELVLPSQDPWYTALPGFEACSPGTVLRVRTLPGSSIPFDHTSKAYHILYRTTGSRYQPAWAVASLFIPENPYTLPSRHNVLLSCQAAYNSANVDWSPSYRLFQPAPASSHGIPTGHDRFNKMLSRGWYVVVPDFEGPRAAFGASVLAGHATLDGIRAVLSLISNDDVLLPNDGRFKYAMWGYSGGSLASEKAAELQVQYAPELSAGLVGAALGGLVSNLGNTFNVVNKSPYTGNLILVLLGIMNEYPDADAYIRSRLRTDGSHNATGFLEGLDMQSLQAFRAFANQDIYAYFKNGQADLKESKVLRRIEKVEWMLGFHGTPEIPLFVYKAIGDHMTPIADTDEHIAQYKRFNVSILYERNTVGDHISEIENGQERAIEWLASVFDGTYDGLDQGVRIRDVAVDIYKPPVA
ncbi:secretory lipase-domain-containing protein [Truncatella angustata]|uniref:Secretory lipase-domain-containing protein n=1 Tax=Truncatella angustata TaxID=152316 RepID=A0A9P8UQ18_9PEZI|nr:secretory lipase-domain-containing protein [Truncatella angustata]KAH6655969.1 secretory lipase-domain-containing protein [Truncatella angustata]